jgi:hypothetical protein
MWNLYSFEPRHGVVKEKAKKGVDGKKQKAMHEYLGHFTPALEKVVPCDEAGNRVIGGWKFYYNRWMPDEFDHQTFVRDDASQLNLKPESCHGLLDVNVLKKHGCNADRIRDDLLFLTNFSFHFVH